MATDPLPDRDPPPTPKLGHPRQARNEGSAPELPKISASARASQHVDDHPFFLVHTASRATRFPRMSATRLSDSKTTSASPYLGSLWLPAASDRKRIDKFGSSTSSAASSSPPPTAPDSFPYTTPPPGALVFKQHVHRYPKPMEPSQKFRLWYRGLFWETLEPVSPFSPPVKVEKRIARCQTFPHRGPGKSPTRLQTFLEDLAEGDRPRAISGRTSSRHQLPSGNATVGANKYRPSFATYLQWENVLVRTSDKFCRCRSSSRRGACDSSVRVSAD